MRAKRIAIVLTVLLLAAPAFGQPARFPLTLPIGGTPYQDWTIVNYVDLMAGSGIVDYRGGTYTYDGHNAIDFTLANFAAMDAGVPVFAAADGTVTFVRDGEFDRCSRVSACGDSPNWVQIDHGGGIVTEYVHLKRDSININVGDPVVAGQQIGLVGSSGLSTDAHLHFTVFEDGSAVETYVDSARWWNNPLPYAGDVLGSLDHGITHHDPTVAELVERPADNDVFQQVDGAGQQAFLWAQLHGVDVGDAIDVFYFRPNGTQYNHLNWTVSQIDPRYDWWRAGTTLPAVPDLGAWQVQLQVNGTTLVSDTFTVVSSAQMRTWNAGTGNWSTAGNWTPVGTPGASDIVRIVNSDGQARTVTYDVAAPTLKSLTIDLTGAGSNRMTFEMSAGNLALVDGLVVGDIGRATFNQSGGRVTSADPNLDSIVGFHAGGDGIYNLSGTGTLSVARDLYVGAFGGSTGTFNQSGGAITAQTLVLGSVAESMGTYAISGGTLSARSQIEVGRSGIGTLNITNAAQVVSTDGGIIAYEAGSTGSVTIDGAGATWTMPTGFGILAIGVAGTGTMTITGGGTVSNVGSVIGQDTDPGASGSVTVSGANSHWQMSAGLAVGQFGAGTLAIQNGGQVTTSGGIVGLEAGSHGSVVIDGAGSKWIDSSSTFIGSTGTGTVTVTSGGELQTPHLLVNRHVSGDGMLIVAGTGSKVTVNGEMRVADEGIGLLRIENGGTLITDTQGYLARNAATAEASAVVIGADSNWTLGLSLTVGGAGVGKLAVEDGGVVSAAGGVSVAVPGTVRGDGTLVADVTNFGTIVPGIATDAPGTLHITGNYTQDASGALNASLTSATNFAKLNVTGNISLSGALSVTAVDFSPLGGQSFDLLDWGSSLSGTFTSIQLPTLDATLTWDTTQLYTTGVISVIGPPGVPGDYNQDGVVDAADYTVWRNNLGSSTSLANDDTPGVGPDDYDRWKINFGATSGPAGGANAHVPEPASAALLLVGLAMFSTTALQRPRTRSE